MKFTLSWLKDHLETSASVEELARTLSAIGLEVESVTNPGEKLAPFIVARVVEAKQHPNADRLRVCQVETGSGVVEVVCGAPNARSGMIGVFAPIGSHIPGTGITLDKRPVRGVVSNGMLLSERELELSDSHEGIIELPDDYAKKVGQPFAEVMGLADPVFDVKLTPNRPDCTGVRGIARDLAAAHLGKLKPERKVSGVEGTYACPVDIKLDFPKEARDACPCFAGRYVKGVKNGPSPAWVQQRLKAVGLRPINALVDVTNYISLDRGRPLHVYDADKLKGAIRARLGKKGETFKGLDGKTHEADETMCVIADDRAVLGFGGILGGEDTGCTEATRNVLIECAYFDPLRTAATGRKTGIQSDARYRFERGVDPAFIRPGLDLATAMILEFTGGAPSKAKVAGAPPEAKTTLSFSFAMVEKLAGIRLKEPQMRSTLEALGFQVSGKGGEVKVAVPSWRPDIHGRADLVEEIVRIAGLDTVPSAPMPRERGVARAVLTQTQRRVQRARRALAARGLVETITWSFISRAAAGAFGGGGDALELANPISADMSSMRPSLLPGLLAALQRNRNRGFADLALFEIGQAYRGDRPEDQFLAATGVRAGTAAASVSGRHWSGNAGMVSLFDAKADVVTLLAALGIDAAKAQTTRDAPAYFHPGRSACLRLGPKILLAQFGEIHPETLRDLDVAGPVAAFELFIDALPPEKKKSAARPMLEAADLMPVRRDFAFVLDASVPAGDVIKAAAGADKALITQVNVFDLFEGKSLGEGKKSLALEVTLQPRDKTLTDEQIEAVSAKIVAEVKRATGGEIRA
ncbi:MAG TPA: phenylalanine--tRNA ligase subunit beta [Hyphomicrobiaceae bacterium]|jgi:phenylalanyl-tRNA synthetase beta chain|nr:phenylalanine--tRNA ligase subunit beta [Hyphomicrobiaceae bacterium]